MTMKNGYSFLILLLWMVGSRSALAEAPFRYLDTEGVPVYSSSAPVQQVENLTNWGGEPAPPEAPSPSKSASFDAIIEKYADDYQLDASLIRSIIATESNFNHKAVSPKGARGLMQLMPATAQRLGVRNSFDPEDNIRGGVKYFRSLMDSFNNDLDLSLAAYNAGENLVRRLGRIPDYRETKDYVASVKRKYGRNEVAQLPPQDTPPPLLRYVDEEGVLHLTNIASPR